jgi:hypothetical protein
MKSKTINVMEDYRPAIVRAGVTDIETAVRYSVRASGGPTIFDMDIEARDVSPENSIPCIVNRIALVCCLDLMGANTKQVLAQLKGKRTCTLRDICVAMAAFPIYLLRDLRTGRNPAETLALNYDAAGVALAEMGSDYDKSSEARRKATLRFVLMNMAAKGVYSPRLEFRDSLRAAAILRLPVLGVAMLVGVLVIGTMHVFGIRSFSTELVWWLGIGGLIWCAISIPSVYWLRDSRFSLEQVDPALP